MMIALWLSVALAQEPLTLAEALERAAVHPLGTVAEARLDQARAARSAAWGSLGPQVTGSGTYTRRTREVTADIGSDDAVLQARHALRAQARADLPLVDPSGYASIAAAGTAVAAQELESDEVRRALGYRVADAYLAVLAEERLVGAAERRAERADEVLAAARARLETGLGTRNDVTRTELEHASARFAAIQARGALAAARATLAALLAVDEVGDLVEPELGPPPAEASRPDLAALELRARQARQEASAVTLQHLPVLGLFATASATNEAGFSGRHADWTAGAAATWTLFDGGTLLATAARGRAVAREIDALAGDLGLEIERERQTARIAHETAEAALEVARVRASVAEQNASEQRERFAAGLATALEVSDAAVAEFEAAADLARQRFETSRALLALAQAAGAWPQETLR